MHQFIALHPVSDGVFWYFPTSCVAQTNLNFQSFFLVGGGLDYRRYPSPSDQTQMKMEHCSYKTLLQGVPVKVPFSPTLPHALKEGK